MKAYQFLPLSLLYHAGGEINGRTKLMKLTFLADQELEDADIDPYDFIPYDYGPFDQNLYEATEWLEKEELIEIEKSYTIGGDERYNYRLTAEARATFDEKIEPLFDQGDIKNGSEEIKKAKTIYEVAKQIVEEYDIPISNLIDRVYDEYPEYAENSVLT